MTKTTAAERIQDPILTELAQGFTNPELVSEVLFPIAESPKEGAKIPKFGKLAFREHSTIREILGTSNRLTPEDVQAISVELEENDLEYPIDYRQANDASYDLKRYALNVVQQNIALKREATVAALAQNSENYDPKNVVVLSGSSKFTHKEADILGIFYTGVEKIKSAIGIAPNVCVISSDVWAVLRNHPAIIERLKYTYSGILTPDVFAKMIGVEVVKIGGAMQEKSGNLVPLWLNSIILAYTPQPTHQKQNIYRPAFGYTVRRQKGLFVDTYQESGGKIEIVRCTDISKPVLVGNSAGYLIKEAI